MNFIKFTALLLGLSGCCAGIAHEAHEHAPVAASASADHSYGQPMPEGAAISIVEAVENSSRYAEGSHKISGRIAKVCQSEGCWMVLADGETSARVMFANHAFVIPTDSTGAAEVYGTVTVKVIDEKTAKHLAADAGQDPDKVVGDAKEVRISATAVLLRTEG